MVPYLILIVVTALLVIGTRWVVRRTGQRSFALGMAVLYTWTFLGAWLFIGDALSGYRGYRFGLNYYYLMEKMFPFELGSAYDAALIGYAVFMGALFLGVWLLWRKRSAVLSTARPSIIVDHRVFLSIALATITVSFLLVRPVMLQAMADNVSIYHYTRSTPYAGSTVHALCNSAASLAVLLGWSIRLTAEGGRSFTDPGQRWANWAYPVVLLILCAYMMLLGNRHELFMALILGTLVFIGNAGKGRRIRLALYAAAVVVPMLITGRFRDYTWGALRTLDMNGPQIDTPFDVPIIAHVPRHARTDLARYGERVFSNELFCTHFALYGIFRYDVRPDPLISARYLGAALVPRALGVERPLSAYDHYAEGAHLTPGQGYTIHHAAAWYINGGWPGIVLGGLLTGLIWGGLMRLRRDPPKRLALRVFALLGVACWTAFLPMLVRAGPEAYKAVVFEGFLLPIAIVFLATIVRRSRSTPGPSAS